MKLKEYGLFVIFCMAMSVNPFFVWRVHLASLEMKNTDFEKDSE
jgi:hypothetical protein